jgi:ferredoxin
MGEVTESGYAATEVARIATEHAHCHGCETCVRARGYGYDVQIVPEGWAMRRYRQVWIYSTLAGAIAAGEAMSHG